MLRQTTVLLGSALAAGCGQGTLDVGSTGSKDSGPRDIGAEAKDILDGGSEARADAAPMDAGCSPGATKSCYSGPPGTEGVGTCVAGMTTCESKGSWGPCIGEVDPEPDVCGGPDSECNGTLPPAACPGDIAVTFPHYAQEDPSDIGLDPTTGNVVLVGQFEGGSANYGLGTMTGSYGLTGFMLTLDPTLTPISQQAFGESNFISIRIDAMGNRFIYDSVDANSVGTLGGGSVAGGAHGAQIFGMFDATGTLTWQVSWVNGPVPDEVAGGFAIYNGQAIFSALADQSTGAIYDYGCGAGTSNHDHAIVELGTGGACVLELHLGSDVAIADLQVQSDGTIIALATYDGAMGVSLGSFPLTSGSSEVLIFAVDTTGTVKWVDAFPGSFGPEFETPNYLGINTIAVGKTNEIYIYGESNQPSLNLGGTPLALASTSPGGCDLVVARFDPNGNYVWGKRIAGDDIAPETGLVATGPSAIFISGTLNEGHVDLGGGYLSPAFVGSLDLSGNYRWGVSEYTDTPVVGFVSGASFLYVLTASGRVEQILY